MTQAQIDRRVYDLAWEFLLNLGVNGVTRSLIEKYLNPGTLAPKPVTIPGIYERMLESAQNAGMKSSVVGKAIGGFSNLGRVLYDFDPAKVLVTYGTDSRKLLNVIEAVLKPAGKVRRTSRSIWPRYSKCILSAARFVTQFKTARDFYRFADLFDADPRTRAALPMMLDLEIDGIGFALACDFLKELGYVGYAKPDVHLRFIFTKLGLCTAKANDYQVFKAVVRVSGSVNQSPYHVDKLFWLIGSGNFYNDPAIGKKGKIGRHREQFVAMVKRRIPELK